MNKFKFYFILFSTLLVLFSSCNKDDDEVASTPLRDFNEQFVADSTAIYTYLTTHYLKEGVTDYAQEVNSVDLIKTLPTTGTIPPTIYSLLNSPTLPKLLYKEVTIASHGMNTPYKVYYLQFREGDNSEKPCPFDEVLVTYRGTSLEKVSEGVVSATEFDQASLGVKFPLNSLVGGWGEIIPLFGKGIFDETATGNGPNVYTNYGAGIMLLPSGLGYFNGTGPTGSIKAYSPLVFSFQLQNFIRVDTDSDGIMTVDELVKNSEGNYVKESYINTDGDNYYDFNDIDDDNDGYTTRNEIKKPDGTLYLFNEIPGCDGFATDPNRIKRHLIKCQ